MAESDAIILRALEAARRDLLDLTARNRLLHVPRGARRTSLLMLPGLDADAVHRRLVGEGRALSFAPRADGPEAVGADDAPDAAPAESARDDSADEAARVRAELASLREEELLQPGDDDGAPDEPGAEAETPPRDDRRLATTLDSAALQQRLLRTFHAARTFEEEQGVNVLHLAIGLLAWRERDDPSKERFAPLLLVPCALERRSAATPFRLRIAEEEVRDNLTLRVRLAQDFGVELPELDAEEEDETSDAEDRAAPSAWFDRVERAIAGLEGWRVIRDEGVLGLFSFTGLQMYLDLDPERWPADAALPEHRLVAGLLGEGVAPSSERPAESASIEPATVLDADASQTEAIRAALEGGDLVVQGPPGTGKSQTIANLIAAAVRDGKRVLFVSEKRAALEVVHRRLERIGLGDSCLALHSHRASKRGVLEEIGRTLALDAPVIDEDAAARAERHALLRDRLDEQVAEMHRPGAPHGRAPYEVVAEIVALRDSGVAAPDFALPAAATWTPEERRERARLLDELAAHVASSGAPSAHPFRGVRGASMLPTDVERLAARLPGLATALDAAQETGAALAQRFAEPAPGTLAAQRRLADLARLRAAAPEGCDLAAWAEHDWPATRTAVADLLATGRRARDAARRLEGRAIDAALQEEWDATRRAIASRGGSLLAWLSGDWRRARRRLLGASLGDPPRRRADLLALADDLLEAAAARRGVAERDALGRRAFGGAWSGMASDWPLLERVVAWEERLAALPGACAEDRRRVAAVRDASGLELPEAAARSAANEAIAILRAIAERLELDLVEAFDVVAGAGAEQVPVAAVRERVAAWCRRPEAIAGWIALRMRRDAARAAGLGPIVDRIDAAALAPGAVADAFALAVAETTLSDLLRERLELADFDGLGHERLREEFRRLDRDRLADMRRVVARAHWERIPRGAAPIGEMGVLRHELAKKRRHLPLRRLFARAGDAIASIKPVFMMSPLSVAQYLEPGGLGFDLLVVDEASQVRPVDALGAVARCGRMVVVGDDRQLPPTTFFRRAVDEEEEAGAEEELRASDLESLLDLCAARGVPSRMLRWHYRSRHHALIATSNRAFYGGRLIVPPSPAASGGDLGLRFVAVPDGIFDRGRSAANRVEAERVAEAVMEHARTRPAESLGVGAFSIRQRDAIIDAIERRRRRARELESFFDDARPEPFFVKNLESVQGDERDVVLISVGYGRDAAGGLTMNFGPLSAEGGERRLNVLITRARKRCVVFSSLQPEDVDLDRATGAGPRALREFLLFARDGAEAAVPRDDGAAVDGFAAMLERQLVSGGHAVRRRVGLSGIFLDLAVVDPDDADAHLLGIETDGAGHREAGPARDRERIREAVLEDRGWRLHRAWSREWLHRPEAESERLLGAVARAIEAARRAREEAARGEDEDDADALDPADAFAAADLEPIERAPSSEAGATPAYLESAFAVPRDLDLGDVAPAKLARIVARVVAIEGPVHRDEVVKRVVRDLWGLGRQTGRSTRIVEGAIDAALQAATIVADGEGFCAVPGAAVVIRDRGEVGSASLREPAMLPGAEIEACLRELVAAHLGVEPEEAATAVARRLGFRAATARLRERVAAVAGRMLAAGALRADEGRWDLGERVGPATPGE